MAVMERTGKEIGGGGGTEEEAEADENCEISPSLIKALV